ncbi:MAG: hypothetical protein LDL41_11190 [Coleofasciculus sp. S288]|nr:hypothetical protein [Coleofasciculus sp. S288]
MSTITGTSFDDCLYGEAGNDYIDAWTGNDYVDGWTGDDTLLGYDGNDYLVGSEGHDWLYGEAGDDTLIGSNPYVWGSGSGEYDTLSGGAGADTFVLGDFYEAYYQGSGFATITDFNWAEGDKIQVFGSASDYSLTPYDYGIDIYYQGDLIGYVQNTTDVIPSLDFIFV